MSTSPSVTDAEAFAAIDQALQAEGPAAALDRLVADLDEHGPPRALLDALLLKARHELGLPAIQDGPLSTLPEAVRNQFEDRYVEAIRRVGSKLLASGDIAGAWPYFRAIGEKEPVAAAITAFEPAPESDERVGAIIEIAFNQGAHPERGFALILDHYGPCSAISSFEQLPPEASVRIPSAERLVRHLHEQLVASLRADIARQDRPVPPDGTTIAGLVADRPWLFSDENYHIDVSHLAAVVRMSTLLTDPEVIRLAIGLTDYGRMLSPRHRYEGDPPFENTYEDYAIYLRALVGEDQDAAIVHFREKLGAVEEGEVLPAQVLVCLLERIERHNEAIDVAAEHLSGVPESMLVCSPLSVLCRKAGRLDRLASIARERGDRVHYAAARLSESARP